MLRGTPEHPKTVALIRALGLSKPHVVGLLELLWHFTARYAPEGDIGRWPDAAIEGGCSWEGESGALIAALLACGWLDDSKTHRLVVHDWHQHADRYVKRRLAAHGRAPVGDQKAPGGRPAGDQAAPEGRPKGDGGGAPPVPVPEPEPEPEPGAPHPPNGRAPRWNPSDDETANGNGQDHDDAPERLDPCGFWLAARTRLAGVVPVHEFATWFRPLESARWDGATFVVDVPDRQFRERLQGTYEGRVRVALHEVGYDGDLQFRVRGREPTSVHDGGL